jgi:mannosyltransferase
LTPRRAAAWLSCCCVLAAALSLRRLGHSSYWLDEAVSVQLALDPWPVFVRTIRTTEANMAAYYLVLRAWTRLGDSETTVRLLSCVAGTLTVPALYAVGARLFGRPAGVTAALLLAADTGRLWASQEARSYALVMCLTTVSWWLLLRAADARTGAGAWRSWTVYVVVAALAVYSHFYAALVLLAQATVALWLPVRTTAPGGGPPERISRGIVLACTAALLALLWPLVLFLRRPHHNIDWIAAAHQDRIAGILSPIVHPTSAWGLAAVTVLVATGPVALLMAWRRIAITARWRYALVLLWLIVPAAATVVTSLIVAPVIDQRYMTICLPPLTLAAAAALITVWPPGWRVAALLLTLALDARSIGWYYTHLEKEDWRDATAYVLTHAAPGDRIVFYAPYTRIPFELYRARAQAARGAPPQGPVHGQSLAAAVDEFRRGAPRVWVVLSHLDSPPCAQAIMEDIGSQFAASEAREFTHIEVRLFSGSHGTLPLEAAHTPAACPPQ